MEAKKAKPYFIELYVDQEKEVKNKFKFVLAATTVKELKELIRDKLISKKELEPDIEFTIKDNDDF
jgi:hypothetical protein